MTRLEPMLPSILPLRSCSLVHLFLILLNVARSVESWGEDGHIIIANLAWRRLSPHVQRRVSIILNITNSTELDDIGSPLGVVANWADHVRHYLPWSGSLHFIDVRDDLIEGGCHYQYHSAHTRGLSSSLSDLCEFEYFQRDCADGVCVAGAILNYSTQLINIQDQLTSRKVEFKSQSNTAGLSKYSSSSRLLRRGLVQSEKGKKKDVAGIQDAPDIRQALMFLIHFVGDIHQPLHVSRSSDKGGNDITVKYHLLATHMAKNNNNTVASKLRLNHHPYNLHSVWDTAMIKTILEREYSSQINSHPRSEMESSLEALLANHTEWLEIFTGCQGGSGARHLECVIGWGQESWSLALKYAYTKNSPWDPSAQQNDVVEVAQGDEIDEAYYTTRIPIVKQQLIAGSIRLAATLEDIFR